VFDGAAMRRARSDSDRTTNRVSSWRLVVRSDPTAHAGLPCRPAVEPYD